MYHVYITQLKNVRKHPSADRLQLGECFGNTVCVDLSYTEGQIGVYFPVDGQLSVEFAEKNNLIRKKDENGNNIGGYLDPDKRRITAIRLRGEKSDGLFLPLDCLESFGNIAKLKVGDKVETFNGHLIATKYIPMPTSVAKTAYKSKTTTRMVTRTPLFKEHIDTEQLSYNLSDFKAGDQIEITLKMHGTSQRTGYLPTLKGCKRTLFDCLLRKKGTPVYDWGYVTGTRRVELDTYDGGYHGSNEFRKEHAEFFEGKLYKGETVYYEVVGFTTSGTPIMPSASNKKLNDKEFLKTYGTETVFSYGCDPTGEKAPQSAAYVYRMTMTNEDGEIIEYTPDYMRYRCEQMGAKVVPCLVKGFIAGDGAVYWVDEDNNEVLVIGAGKEKTKGNPLSFECITGESVERVVELFYDGKDPIGLTHIREGVVVRIVNKPKFTAYKHRNFTFKVLSGIAVAQLEDTQVKLSDDILAEV